MTTYNYLEAITDDVREYINDEIDRADWTDNRDGLEEKLNGDLWVDDSVTGNASGSYTFNTWQAEENLCHNMELLEEACSEFGDDMGELVKRGAEICDVTIRCYLLSQAIADVLDELENDGYFEEDEEDEEDEEKTER